MGRFWPGVFAVFVGLATLPTVADAQGGTPQARSCRQTLPSDFRRIVNTRGEEVIYFSDPVRFRCTGSVLLEADSAVMNRGASSVELIGGVVYQDSIRGLRSGWANYLGRVDQLLARDSVVLRDLDGGAVIRGGNLNYLRQTGDRPQARMIITGGRPLAVIPPPQDSTAAGDVVDSMRVRADRLELEGEEIFRARGSVELERGDMQGRGREALFDQAAERMTLTDSAAVWNESYRLDAERIDAFLEGDGLREVNAERAARLASEELNVFAERIRIGFVDGGLERLEAWNPGGAEGGRRARAEAPDFKLRADSIDARADSLGIRELRAIGRAYGERDVVEEGDEAGAGMEAGDDATDADAEAEAEAEAEAAAEAEALRRSSAVLPAAIDRDWIQGDTILGFFSHADVESDTADGASVLAGAGVEDAAAGEARGDSARAVLERIVVVGGERPALSLYRMAADEPGGRPALNFMRASRIILFMAQGEVERVEAEGPIQGLYMNPTRSEVGGGEARPGGRGSGARGIGAQARER